MLLAFLNKKERWREDMHRGSIAIDDDAGKFLIRLPHQREGDGTSRYMFGCPLGVAILREWPARTYSFLYISPRLSPELELVKEEIREAFQAAGSEIDGTTDPASPFAVPNAKFA